MAQKNKQTPEPIQLKSKIGIWRKWQDFVEWKNNQLHDIKLWIAAMAVSSLDEDGDMQRLALTFPEDIVHQDDHQSLVDLIEGLKIKEEKLKKKGKVVRKRNLQIKGLKLEIEDLDEEVSQRDVLIQLLLEEGGLTMEEFLLQVTAAQTELNKTGLVLDRELKANAETQEKLAAAQAVLAKN